MLTDWFGLTKKILYIKDTYKIFYISFIYFANVTKLND